MARTVLLGLLVVLLAAGHGLAVGVADVTGAAQDALDTATDKTGTGDAIALAGGIVLGNAFDLLSQAQPGSVVRTVHALLGV